MATKVKPTRLQITGTPQAGDVPVYVDSDCFCWGAGGGGGGSGDMEKCVYDPNNCNDDAFDYCNFYNTPDMSCYAQCSDIPTDNCQLDNGCGYLTNSDLSCYAQCCDIPTNNCQLINGCGYTTCTGTLSTCSDVISALGYTPYNSTNPNGYTTCTGTVVAGDIANLAQCCDIPTNNCQLTNGCGYTTCTGTVSTCADVISALGYTPYNCTNPAGYTTCTGTVVASDLTPYAKSCDIACVNGCCLTNGGNITISGGANYSWCTQTISGGNVTLCLRTIVNVPTSDFTLVKPDTLIDGEEYAIRVISETSYCMCLGSCFKNPWNVDTTLSGNATDQYVFLAINGELELQPLVDTGA